MFFSSHFTSETIKYVVFYFTSCIHFMLKEKTNNSIVFISVCSKEMLCK